jgi:hypothetical protein
LPGLLLLLIAAQASAFGPQPNPEDAPAEPTSVEEEAIEDAQEPFPGLEDPDRPEPPPAAPGEDECDWELEDQPIQEQSQEVVRSVTCHGFRWFDSWWGDEEDFDERSVNGWVTLGTSYRKYDGFEPRMRLRVRAPLPNLDKRWDVLLGRVDEEAFVSDTDAQDRTFYNPGVVDRNEDAEWLLGLGKRRNRLRRGWDWSAGVRLRLPPRPYVKASYFYNTRPSENTDLRLRQTFFWRSDNGFGTTTRGDFSWGISATDVLRWEATATAHEETEGARWYAGQTWYHLLGDLGAFSFLAFARGETDYEVGVKDAGFNLTWRRQFTRDWMYLSMGPSFTWPREKAEDEREFNLGFGIWLEMEFGDWRY